MRENRCKGEETKMKEEEGWAGEGRSKKRDTGVILHSLGVCLAKSAMVEQRIMGLESMSMVK